MPDNDSDRTKNTAQFQAFVDKVDDTDQPRSKGWLRVVIVVLAVLVVVAVGAYGLLI